MQERMTQARADLERKLVAVGLPAELAIHNYVSTACIHGLCESCRLTCKYCLSRCLCMCHREEAHDDQLEAVVGETARVAA